MKKGCLSIIAVLALGSLEASEVLQDVVPTSLFSHVLSHHYERDRLGHESAVYCVEAADDFMRLISQTTFPVVFRFISDSRNDRLLEPIQEMARELNGRVVFASINLEHAQDLGRDISQMILSFVAQLQASGSQVAQLIPMLMYIAQGLSQYDSARKPLFLYAHNKALIFPSTLHFESAQSLYDDVSKKFLGRISVQGKKGSGFFDRLKAWLYQ